MVQRRLNVFGDLIDTGDLPTMVSNLMAPGRLAGLDFSVAAADQLSITPGTCLLPDGVLILEDQIKTLLVPNSSFSTSYTVIYRLQDARVLGGSPALLSLLPGLAPQSNFTDATVLGWIQYPGGSVPLQPSQFNQPTSLQVQPQDHRINFTATAPFAGAIRPPGSRPGGVALRSLPVADLAANLSQTMAFGGLPARILGASTDAIGAAVAAFRPLPHRLEPVGRMGGILFVNDSKATTPLAARLALEAFAEPIVLIAGGYDKHADPAPMVEAIRARAKATVLLGATAGALAAAIGRDAGAVERAADLDDAVRRAVRLAAPGDVVLLSPGHASWDMFDNYEQRGDRFRQAAERLGMQPLQPDPPDGRP